MRVVAGEARSRILVAPVGVDTRPTSDRVREAIFNALTSIDAIDGAKVLDLFAGSGALGIEALSRWAAHCTFIERGRPALESLRTNLATTRLQDRAEVIVGDVMTYASAGRLTGYDLVLADPPYVFDQWEDLFAGLDAAGIVVVESDRPIPAPAGWQVFKEKRYGRTSVTFLEPSGGNSADEQS